MIVINIREEDWRLIHGAWMNIIPRTAAMVVGKVSSGLLQPVCRICHVLGLGVDFFDLVVDLER